MSSDLLAVGTVEFAFLALFTAAILLVPAHATTARFVSLAAVSALTYTLQETFTQLCSNGHWRAVAVPLIWIQLLSASDLIFISRLSSASIPSGTSPKSRIKAITSKAIQAIALLWNARRVGTRWQVKNVPASSSSWSRARFVQRRLATTLAAYLVLDLTASAPLPDPVLLSPPKATLYKPGSLSSEDVVFRIIATASFGLCAALIDLVVANTLAIGCVLSGLSSPQDWPPLYGPIREAYSVRRFWEVSWHQWLRRGLAGHANTVVDFALPVRRSTILSRYARLTVAFFISGLIHHAADLTMGVPTHEAGALVFFLLQPLGILLEEVVQSLTRTVRVSSRFRRAVGYLWLALFMTWATPTWFYPLHRLGEDPGLLLPVRVVGPVLDWLKGVVRG